MFCFQLSLSTCIHNCCTCWDYGSWINNIFNFCSYYVKIGRFIRNIRRYLEKISRYLEFFLRYLEIFWEFQERYLGDFMWYLWLSLLQGGGVGEPLSILQHYNQSTWSFTPPPASAPDRSRCNWILHIKCLWSGRIDHMVLRSYNHKYFTSYLRPVAEHQ